ncbi:MAG: hypothetical protein KDB25_01290 [Leucobacter sp.]|nr:hypothetical protein [Leucobacter sp.]
MSFAPTRTRHGASPRLVWMLPAGLCLLAGLDAALLLLGLPAPVTTKRLPETHGMLLTIGFIGTLVALERATALRRWYGYLAPGLLGLGGVLLIADPVPLTVAKAVLVAGTAAFTTVYIPLWHRRYDAQLLVQLLGAGFALAAAILWLGGVEFALLLPWIYAFIVLTIAAERVELAITLGPGAGGRLLAHAWGIAVALLIGLASPRIGAIALGVAFLALTFWLLRHDIARRTIRARGATRYMAACMLGGYFWLALAGVALLLSSPNGFPATQAAYDAVTHAILLGFAMSMIMAHAPTILPAVLHIPLPYRTAFWVPAALLHLSLVVRIWLGDGLGITVAFTVGGALGVAALLIFAVTALTSAIIGPPKREGRARPGGGDARTVEDEPADEDEPVEGTTRTPSKGTANG